MVFLLGQIVQCQVVGCLVNNELEGILQEVVVVYFEVVSTCLHVGAEENHVMLASCWAEI